MFNKILEFSQNKTVHLYENSLFLQNIDKFILLFIWLTYIGSTFMQSDSIGFFAIIVIFLTILKLITKKGQTIKLNTFDIWLIVYFMIVVISLFGSTLFSLSLKGFFKTFLYIGFYFSIAQYLKAKTTHIKWILLPICLCASIEIISGFMQSFLQLGEISTWQDTSSINPEDVISRVYGTLKPYNPNLFGGYLISVFPAILGSAFIFVTNKHYKSALIALSLCIFGCYTIFQTGCRGAYLALILIFGSAFIISAKFLWKKYKKTYLTFLSGMVGLFVFVLIFINSIRHRFLSIFAMRADSSNSFRFNVYHSSIDMFKDNWLLGIGVGNKNFREIYGLYMKTGFDALSAYNIFLETAVESGIFALLAFLGFLISLSLSAIKFIFSSNNYNQIIYASIAIISILAIIFHGLVDTIYFRPQLQFIFWSYVAIISALTSKN